MANNIIKSAWLRFVTIVKLLILELIIYVTTNSDGTVNQRLYNLLHFKTSAPATKRINTLLISTLDVAIDPSRNLWFRLFNPTTTTTIRSLPLIVYFHGGGFSKYGPDTTLFDHLCTHLAAGAPAVIASVNYRLTPKHKYPAQYEDAFDVLKFIDAQHHILPANTDLTKCFIGGDSAGANIAHHVTVRAVEKAEQFDKIRIIGLLGLQPFFGGQQRTESELRLPNAPVLSVKQADAYWREFLPEGADRNHPAVNVSGGGPNSALLKNLDFPTALVIVGGNDPLQDWDRRYVEWLKDCGKRVVVAEYPNAFHGFYAIPEMPEFALLIDDVANFIREQVNSN